MELEALKNEWLKDPVFAAEYAALSDLYEKANELIRRDVTESVTSYEFAAANCDFYGINAETKHGI